MREEAKISTVSKSCVGAERFLWACALYPQFFVSDPADAYLDFLCARENLTRERFQSPTTSTSAGWIRISRSSSASWDSSGLLACWKTLFTTSLRLYRSLLTVPLTLAVREEALESVLHSERIIGPFSASMSLTCSTLKKDGYRKNL